MQSKQDGLVPIGDALSDLGGPVQALREATPQSCGSEPKPRASPWEPTCAAGR